MSAFGGKADMGVSTVAGKNVSPGRVDVRYCTDLAAAPVDDVINKQFHV